MEQFLKKVLGILCLIMCACDVVMLIYCSKFDDPKIYVIAALIFMLLACGTCHLLFPGVGEAESWIDGMSDRVLKDVRSTGIHNLILLDASSSMWTIREQALRGINETIRTIKEANDKESSVRHYITIVAFSDSGARNSVRTIIDCVPAGKVRELARRNYTPDGDTPLFDAMGISINALRAKIGKKAKTLVTIITDGQDNSSCKYSGDEIKALVDELSENGWTFTYIGANQDSIRFASTIGIKSAMDFKADAESSEAMFRKMNSYRMEYYHNVNDEGYREEDFFQTREETRVTPENISSLKPGEIFVFGSNISGSHTGGASLFALEHFGAVMGQGNGLQGQSYAIPTVFKSVTPIREYVWEFIHFADMHRELTFYVTRIGCGVAGFRDEEIAPLFADAVGLRNIYLPASFWEILRRL